MSTAIEFLKVGNLPYLEEIQDPDACVTAKSFDAGDDKKADAYYDEFDKTSSGVPLDPDKPTTGGGDVTGEELYTRFIETKYFPQCF